MRSKKAKMFIKEAFGATRGNAIATVAAEFAENEMREKAIQCFIQCCEYFPVDETTCGRKGFASCEKSIQCKKVDCNKVREFIGLLDNDKTEQL